jgi:regulatory protein
VTASSADAALQHAFELLSRRDFTVAGLTDKLRSKGHDQSDARAAVERCLELGYVDDHAFGRARAATVLERKPSGRRGLLQDLRRQGLDSTMAEQVAGEAYAELGGEAAVLRSALQRWIDRHGEPSDWREAKRCADHLARRGFASAAVHDALSPWLDELGT